MVLKGRSTRPRSGRLLAAASASACTSGGKSSGTPTSRRIASKPPRRAAGGATRMRRAGTSAAEARSVDHAALVRPDADRAVALGDLDVEPELAAVNDLVQAGAGRACRALG